MGSNGLNQITVTPQKRIYVEGGDVLHALKAQESSYKGFAEAYFSFVNHRFVKAWKKHLRMTLNLLVPQGEVRFVFFDDQTKQFRQECIGENNHARITVPPGIWFGFQGLVAPTSLVLNLANIEHDPQEVERCSKESLEFDWEIT